MQVVLIGLGRMGANMARRWARGVNVVAFDQSEGRAAAATTGTVPPSDCEACRCRCWCHAANCRLMLPAGEVTESDHCGMLPQCARGPAG